MPTRQETINFGAGPATLPTAVLEEASSSLLNYADLGMSLVEISHRSAHANAILAEANSHLRELLDVPDTYEVFWQQGGGTAQFSAVVYNLVAAYIARGGSIDGMKCDYLLTGGWSKKAYEECVRLGIGTTNVVFDAREWNNGKWGVIPSVEKWKMSEAEKTVFLYYCDNETVDGVEFPLGMVERAVSKNVPIVCDMSSNILSRKFDITKFAVVYVHP